MFCPQCGSQVPDNSKSCERCGAPLAATEVAGNSGGGSTAAAATGGAYSPPAAGESAGPLAIGALICGILSFLGCACFTGIPAIIMGKMELNKIEQGLSSRAGKGLAFAGFIMGIINLVLALLVMGLYFVLIVLGVAAGGFSH